MTLTEWLRDPSPASRLQARMVQGYLSWLRFRRNPLAMIGLTISLALILMAIFAPLLTAYDPITQNLSERLWPPGTPGHWMGTDDFGRDIWARIVYGSRITLYIVLLVILTAPVAGLIIGTAAGYFGGWVDQVLMRITDIFLAFPKLILALALVAVLGRGMENAVLAIALTSWPPYARVARAETLTVRTSDYIAAVRLQGAGPVRMIWGHVMPMCLPSVIIRVTLDMAGVILTAAGLGFLGMGVQPPTPEWGVMISARAQVPVRTMVGGDDAGPCHLHGLARLQPVGRRPARRARPQELRQMTTPAPQPEPSRPVPPVAAKPPLPDDHPRPAPKRTCTPHLWSARR